MNVALLLFRALLRLLPQSYSNQQRDDALALTARLANEVRDRSGQIAAASFMLGALVDLIGQVLYARARPNLVHDVFRGLSRDLHQGFRVMAAKPGYSAAVIAVLAIGIGLNAAVFSVVDWVLLRPLPYPSPDALVRVWAADKASLGTPGDLAYSEVEALSRASRFRASAGLSLVTRVVSAPRLEPIHATVARVTGNVFGVLGTYPVVGRGFDSREMAAGSPVVVLSHGFWRTRFGSDLGVLGAALTLDNVPHTIVGVMPAGRGYPFDADLWRPATAGEREDDDRENIMIARLGDGVGDATAMTELSTLLPPATGSSAGRVVWVESLHASEVRGVRAVLWWILGGAALVMAVACANVAALIGTRGLDRAGELAMRGALGASRLQLARQLLIEGLVLATAGGALGIITGAVALGMMVAVAPPGLPRLSEITLDARVIALGVLLMLTAGITVSLAPAWRAAQTDLAATLNAAASPRSSARHASRRWLVAVQLIAAVALTIAAALLTRSLQRLINVDHGFDPDNVVAVSLDMRRTQPGEVAPLFTRLVNATETLPGVRSAAVAFRLPTDVTGLRVPLRLENASTDQASAVALRLITPRYFETAGIPLLQGRTLAATDLRDRPRVAVVNRAFVRDVLAGASPLDQRVTGELIEAGVSVVGVVGDVTPAGQPDRPALYMSYAQFSINAGTLLVKSALNPSTLLPGLRERIHSVAPALPLDRIQTLDDALAAGRSIARFNTLLASSFGILALMLSMIGVYGLTSREVANRRRESGVRIALGANPAAVLWELTRPIARLTMVGIIGGAAVAIAAASWMRALLHGIAPIDPPTFLLVPLSIVLIAAAAVLAAAWPILRTDPVRALRN